MRRIEPWSTLLTMPSLRSIHPPISGCNNCPQTKGTNSCNVISPTVCHADADLTWLESIRFTASGVTKMPMILEAEALQIAAGTLPLAIDVKAIEDCTVDGS